MLYSKIVNSLMKLCVEVVALFFFCNLRFTQQERPLGPFLSKSFQKMMILAFEASSAASLNYIFFEFYPNRLSVSKRFKSSSSSFRDLPPKICYCSFVLVMHWVPGICPKMCF